MTSRPLSGASVHARLRNLAQAGSGNLEPIRKIWCTELQ